MSEPHKTELENFYDNFAGFDWDHCIRFFKEVRTSGLNLMREMDSNTHLFQVGNMMLELARKLGKAAYFREVPNVISHHCLRLGLPHRPIFKSPQIWVYWNPTKKSYAVGQPLNNQFAWTQVDAENIVQVLQQGLEQLQYVDEHQE